jgi:hypothetical protein
MANVAIRLSVENAETVRQALQALGKDGEKALRQLETGTAAPNRGLNALSSLVDDAKSRFMGLATSIGPAGSAMIQLGPAGLAAAGAIGLLGAAFNSAAERAQQFGEWARRVREAAETAGVSTDMLQALAQAGDRAGLSFDQSAQFLTKLTTSVEQLRQGTGPLFEALARIDAGLVRDVASARTTSEAFDILARAFQRLTDAGQRNRLAQAIGGEGGVGAGRILAGWMGSPEEVERTARAQRLASEQQLSSADEMWRSIQRTRQEADQIWSRMFSQPALNALQAAADVWLGIARTAETIARFSRQAVEDQSRVGQAGNLALGPQGGRPMGSGQRPPTPAEMFAQGGMTLLPGTAPPEPSALAAELALMRRWTSVLGDALTPAEQLAQRILELRVAQEAGAITDGQRARALAAFTRAQDAASTSTRNRLGIVTQEETLATRMRELDDLQSRGFIKNAEERAQAERLVRREVRETMEALRVRQSV